MLHSTNGNSSPWQLEMFQRSLKKQLKLQALLDTVGDLRGKRCLLVTCGDNNGALNWHFRQHGGQWYWADTGNESLAEMAGLLREPVHQVAAGALPFADKAFDVVVAIDVLEHLADDRTFLDELYRVLRPGGQAIITVPNGDPALPANRVKQRLGMTPAIYGHTRAGYTVAELRDRVGGAGLVPIRNGGYSRFFTEMVELLINFGYVFVLSSRGKSAPAGKIAPTSSADLKSHGLAYRLYARAFPLLRTLSLLDRILPAGANHAVIVTAVRLGVHR